MKIKNKKVLDDKNEDELEKNMQVCNASQQVCNV